MKSIKSGTEPPLIDQLGVAMDWLEERGRLPLKRRRLGSKSGRDVFKIGKTYIRINHYRFAERGKFLFGGRARAAGRILRRLSVVSNRSVLAIVELDLLVELLRMAPKLLKLNFSICEWFSVDWPAWKTISPFYSSYCQTAIWASANLGDYATGDNPEPLDDLGYTISDITENGADRATVDCVLFMALNREDIGDEKQNLERAGHDFWMTRNHHGAGFWDGDWPEEAGQRMTKWAETFGELSLIEGDSGHLSFE